MSIHRSYFKRNNTIINNSFTNTGKSPITELYFGSSTDFYSSPGFSRFIFDLDLTDLIQKISNKTIPQYGCNFSSTTHTLRMTNTSSFDNELLNTSTSEGRKRATSFDLILFRIPKTSGTTGTPQTWDEGVGYDYYDIKKTENSTNALLTPLVLPEDKSYSNRPSNWYQRNTLSGWSEYGIYSNKNNGNVNYNNLIIVDTQHFEFGNEDIEFNMTNEINSILTGGTTGVTGWGIAFVPELENLSGLTQNYSVGFFTRHTQTFYQPFLETTYNDFVDDDRNSFYSNKVNKLYLYSYINGELTSLDQYPQVEIRNHLDETVTTEVSCEVTTGIYQISFSASSITTPCMWTDEWSNLEYNNIAIPNITNDLVVLPFKNYFTLGTESKDPSIYGFDFYGIKQNEKIVNTDIRKVGVVIKKAYSTNEVLTPVTASYRVYVREGQTEVQVQDWTRINRTSNEFFFMFDTRDKLPNEYFIDIKVLSSGQVDTYKRTLQFQIVNQK